MPDLAIEMIVTSGLVDKLEIYRGLGVAEVWQWQSGRLLICRFRSVGYEVVRESPLLPDLVLAC